MRVLIHDHGGAQPTRGVSGSTASGAGEMPVSMERLFDDAVAQVCDLVPFAYFSLVEADVLAAETVEETDPFAQEHGHHIHVDFIEQAGHHKLLLDIGPHQMNIFVTGQRRSNGQGPFNAVAHEGPDRLPVPGCRLPRRL